MHRKVRRIFHDDVSNYVSRQFCVPCWSKRRPIIQQSYLTPLFHAFTPNNEIAFALLRTKGSLGVTFPKPSSFIMRPKYCLVLSVMIPVFFYNFFVAHMFIPWSSQYRCVGSYLIIGYHISLNFCVASSILFILKEIAQHSLPWRKFPLT